MEATTRKPYPSDLTDDQWMTIELVIPPEKPGGRHREVDMREVLNGIFYVLRSGCQWDMLPHDLPPKSTVYEYFSQWRDDGTWELITDVLRCAVRMQDAPSEEMTPSAASIDSQTVKTAGSGGERGYDGGKKITGRKRHIAVDTLGLLMAVVVTSAAVDDAAAAPQLLAQLNAEDFPRLEVVWADNKYHNHALEAWLAKQKDLPWRLEVVSRLTGVKGFHVIPKRWVTERTFAWLGRCRRMSKEYERRTDSSECMVRLCCIRQCVNRLAPKPTQPQFNYRIKC